MKEIYRLKTTPCAKEENEIVGEKYRITLLTERLVRLEYSEDGIFEDRATQTVLHRDFPAVKKRIMRQDGHIEVYTDCLHISYEEGPFGERNLRIQVGGKTEGNGIWYFGKEANDLGGTARTLDTADGEVPLGPGIVSRYGYAVLDDSRSQALLEDGWVVPRKKGIQDLYFFGYGHSYKEALADFYRLCGGTPMLPRFALGNWWSRYYPYTEDGYLALLDRFEREEVPLTVGVMDMDWHLVDIDPKYGSGWTGYTWNRKLFPEPEKFLKKLHEKGLKVTLNVHPADGVRAYEEVYAKMSDVMGTDSASGEPVAFDAADPKFMEAYFTCVHHPREEEGVDFWWIDWQQGSHSRQEGLDPLWILNHFHFLDSARNGKRPMILSRYAGPGSHRYPVGFSGDTIITWKSLEFQPYFTATAANIGYGWWSHDIGGHMKGYKNDELMARWIQLGVYSPILRLHSSNGEFNGKEPWRFGKNTESVMKEMLRERHRLLPYLYTMNYRSYKEGLPLVMPLYYEYPEEPQAYQKKNEFFFGESLLVAPITSPAAKKINLAAVSVWLPDGIWYDIYTGMRYTGGRTLNMYRDLNSIPVLAKAGTVFPLTDETDSRIAAGNPSSLRIRVFAGASGKFRLYEDDNETCAYEEKICAWTEMEYTEGKTSVFKIHPVKGVSGLVPSERSYTIEITGYRAEDICAYADEEKIPLKTAYDTKNSTMSIMMQKADVTKELRVEIHKCTKNGNRELERCFELLEHSEIEFDQKDDIYNLLQRSLNRPAAIAELNSMMMDRNLYGALLEILTADAACAAAGSPE